MFLRKNKKNKPILIENSTKSVKKTIADLDEFLSSPANQEVLRLSQEKYQECISSAKEAFTAVVKEGIFDKIPFYKGYDSFRYFEISCNLKERENGDIIWSISSGDYKKFGNNLESWRSENFLEITLNREDEKFSIFWAIKEEEFHFDHNETLSSFFLEPMLQQMNAFSFYALKFRKNKAEFVANQRYDEKDKLSWDVKKSPKIIYSVRTLEREIFSYYEKGKISEKIQLECEELLNDIKAIAPFVDEIIDVERKFRIQKTLLDDVRGLIQEFLLLNEEFQKKRELDFLTSLQKIHELLKQELSGFKKNDDSSFSKRIQLIDKRYPT